MTFIFHLEDLIGGLYKKFVEIEGLKQQINPLTKGFWADFNKRGIASMK